MADFTGMTVRVTLKGPQNVVLEGKVMQVVPGEQSLWLQDVFFPHNRSRYQSYTVRGPSILDLQVVNTNATPTPTSAVRTNAPPLPANGNAQPSALQPLAPLVQQTSHVPLRTGNGQPQRQPSDFVDPAILSYGRSPMQTKTVSKPPEPATPVKSALAKAAESLPNNSSPFVAEAGKSSGSRKDSRVKDVGQQQAVAKRPATVQMQADGTQETGQADVASKKKARRTQKKKPGNGASDPPPVVMNSEVSRNGNDMNGSVKRGKGWRQTPLLQPSPQADSSHSKGSVRKTRREQESAKEAQQNGWATEDATDIQELGDFDFEANHRLFDKKQVFDELRQGDTTADEDRLVSHNQVHRPGTYGGKNLHPTENVLSPQLAPKYNSNELDSTSDADTEFNFANGRSSSRHSATRTSIKKQPSRQNSAQVESKPHPLSASMSSDRPLNRSVTSLSARPGRPVPSLATSSPRPDRTQSPHSAVSTTKSHATPRLSSHIQEPHLAIYPSMTACPVLVPSGLETLGKETVARYGLTHDAITESAARSIAETAMRVLDNAPGSRRPSRANTLRGTMSAGLGIDHSSPPVIVIIAGNHATGARAVAAARHLVCRKTTIIIVEAQYESADTQDVQMKTQIAILKRMVKSGASIKRGPWRRASGYIKNLSGPPAVIVDALLAGSTFELLLDSSNAEHAAQAQTEAREMIDWANRSRAPVVSVGCPSGVSGEDGSTTTIEGEPLAIRPDKVLCLAAPMQGVLDAMKGGERWEISLADIGINIALRSDEVVPFGSQWVTELKYVEDEGQSAEQQ